MDLFASSGFTKHVVELMEEWHVPGLAIALVQDDTISSRGYGKIAFSIEDVEDETPVTADTVFDIASSSKSLTAAAVALLVSDDEQYPQVQWDTLVSKLLPDDFALAEESYTAGVTVEDILSHRTGLPGHDWSYFSPRAKHPDTLQSVTQNLRNLELGPPIRAKHIYNNLLFTVAAYLVEKVSGLSFEEFLRKHFWEPLQMNSTNLLSKNAIAAGLPIAHPSQWDSDNNKYKPVEFQDTPEALGAGLVVTSVNDYIRWIKALMNQEAPITEEVYKDLTLPRSFDDIENIDNLDPLTSPRLYTAGLETWYYRGYQVVNHDGLDPTFPGVASGFFFLPKIKFGGVILANSGAASGMKFVLMQELIDEALRVPQDERPDWLTRERDLIKREEQEGKEHREKQRKELCPDSDGTPQAHNVPLEAYTGDFWNVGYKNMRVETTKEGKLFIDANDRTMGFTLTFEHLCNGTKFIAHRCDYYEGGDIEIAAEFVFEDDEAVKMGLNLEDDVPGERIWFEKIRPNITLPTR